MSRYKKNYEKHQFHETWKELKARSKELRDADEVSEHYVGEIARFKKVISRLDELISAIDPETAPFGIWNDILNKAQQCLDYVNGYIGDSGIGYIEEANNYADQLLPLLRPYTLVPPDVSPSYGKFVNDLEGFSRERTTKIIDGVQSRVNKTNETIDGALEILNKKQGDIEESHKRIKSSEDKVRTFCLKIFGEENEEGELSGGVDQKIKKSLDTLIKYDEEQRDIHEALINEIKTLLPGATSAGLSTAYRDMKRSFNMPIIIFNCLFYLSLSVLIFISIESFQVWPPDIDFVKFDSWDALLKGLSAKFPIYTALIWLAIFSTKRRSEAQRLKQEYAHKEALAKSYNSYKEQINKLGDQSKDLSKDLIEKTIHAIAYNASVTLNRKHGDKTLIQEALDIFRKEQKDTESSPT